MKKLLLVVCFLFFYSCVNAQQSFLFKLKYLPDHIYESNIKMDMNMEMNFSGDSAAMAKIKAKGIKLPMELSSNTRMDLEIATGKIKSENIFPMVVSYKNITYKKTINGNESQGAQNPLLGQKVYANYTTDGKINIDSISGKTLNDQIKSTLEKAITNVINQIKFPDHPLKVGETFTQEVPFNLPMAGLNIDMAIKIIYKLNHVESGLAYFDLDESLSLNMATQQNGTSITTDGSGKGDGKMIYDINQNFATDINSNIKFIFKVLAGKLNITADATMVSEHTTTISSVGN